MIYHIHEQSAFTPFFEFRKSLFPPLIHTSRGKKIIPGVFPTHTSLKMIQNFCLFIHNFCIHNHVNKEYFHTEMKGMKATFNGLAKVFPLWKPVTATWEKTLYLNYPLPCYKKDRVLAKNGPLYSNTPIKQTAIICWQTKPLGSSTYQLRRWSARKE